MPTPPDYPERVYAGVLGKIVGVYLGRPFEGWTYERITAELGEINYYVHDRLGKPLVVTDDDIAGTFTFLRALGDHGCRRDLTPAQIGEAWLNYLIEGRTVLWWGGLGNSTEHTAYLRLKAGVPAPESGSIALNGQTVAEQIGAQIFIDGWGMVAPGDPALAADLAGRAARVSHDGEAVYAAQALAAMEAQAFVEPDLSRLLDVGLAAIPRDCLIRRLIDDLRAWHASEPDWRRARERIVERYGYDRYGGNCHVVPNHALIILSLLYGGGDLQRSLMIVNTCGWDTDCNSGNVGCLLGIRGGLAALETGPDWRGPVADRLYLPTADGGRAVNDALRVAYEIVNIGRALAGEAPLAPKGGARYHFALPGAVQGFRPAQGNVAVENPSGGSLAVRYHHVAPAQAARVATATFIPPDAAGMPGYGLVASPTLYPGQTVRAAVFADQANAAAVTCGLYIACYGAEDGPSITRGPAVTLAPGAHQELAWTLGDTGGSPIAEVGLELTSDRRADGTVYLDYLTWSGAPDVVLARPAGGGEMWRRAWVEGVDQLVSRAPEAYRLVQNRGRGLLIQGTREWTDYRVSASLTPRLAQAAGLAARVQGLRRYYALELWREDRVRLVKALGEPRALAEAEFPWRFFGTYELALEAVGNRLRGWVDGRLLFDLEDADEPLEAGAVALVCEEGSLASDAVTVRPAGGGREPQRRERRQGARRR